ncbi:MAG: ArsR/SmtB family transcription factor [Promethearchaeota archaeon]
MNKDDSLSHPEILKVSRIFRALAYPKRLEILMVLSTETSLTFAQLLNIIELGKTALANHLAELEKLHMISKPKRGVYSISQRGFRFLNLNTSLYEEMDAVSDENASGKDYSRSEAVKIKQERDLKSEKVSDTLSGGINLEKSVSVSKIPNRILCDNTALMVSHPNSFVGCLAGVLKSLGKDYDTTDVSCITGFAFLYRFPQTLDINCQSIPFGSDIWDIIAKNCRYFGVSLKSVQLNASFPSSPNVITLEDLARAQKIFRSVKQEISEDHCPKILWGGLIPEYYIVNGVNGYNYILHGLNSERKIKEFELRFDFINSPLYMQVWSVIVEKEEITNKMDEHDLVVQFIRLLEGEGVKNDKFVTGLESLKKWADYLMQSNLNAESFDFSYQNLLSQYFLTQLLEAANFLKRIVEKYPRKTWNHYLEEAIFHLHQAYKHMQKYPVLFSSTLNSHNFPVSCSGGAFLIKKSADCLYHVLKSLKSAEVLW